MLVRFSILTDSVKNRDFSIR